MKLEIAKMMDPRNERLPKKTGIGGKMVRMKFHPLFNPEHTTKGNQRLQANLQASRPNSPKQARGAMLRQANLAVDRINAHLATTAGSSKGVRFTVDQASGKTVATIRDSRTGAALKSFPGDMAITLSRRLRDASGMFKSTKV